MREKQLEKKDILFIVCISLFVSTVMLDMSLFHTDGKVVQILRYFGYALILWKLVSDTYDRRTLALYLAGAILLVAGFLVNRNQVMILYSLVLFAAGSVSDHLILKTYLLIQSIMLTVIVAFSQLGLVKDYIFSSPARTRHFLGFDYTTTPPILFFYIILEYVCLRKGKLHLWEYVLGMAVTFWFYAMTDTNYAFWCSILALSFFFFFGRGMHKGYFTSTFRKTFYAAPWIAAVFSIAAQFAYDEDNAFFRKINSMVHGRLALGKSGIETYGFHFFGSNIEWVGNAYSNIIKYGTMSYGYYNYVDSSYLQLALQQGILFLVVVLTLYSFIAYRSIKQGKYYLPWVILFVLLLAVTEPRLVNPVFNPFLMLAFCKMEHREGAEFLPTHQV